MQYLVLIHSNPTKQSTNEEWESFFTIANKSGSFKGGSEVGNKIRYGNIDTKSSIDHINGYMRFDVNKLSELHEILENLPIIINGGTVDICELPESE
ncbi:MAG: hypothetical protein COA79_20725 [Planctomycetota bacterium]|nr:MAG: hypothetical protein COA79_20725 [Planctomycetota bacterium]